MKCVMIEGDPQTVRRVSDERAQEMISWGTSWVYCPKNVWKKLKKEESK